VSTRTKHKPVNDVAKFANDDGIVPLREFELKERDCRDDN
jgi:hypothetical protein